MDRRGWPWKKKSSEKNSTEKLGSASGGSANTLAEAASLGSQDSKKVSYVQISLDSYKHMSGLEDQVYTLENQVKTLEHQVKDLEGTLSAAYLEVSIKENLVKQHAKVAEEAVSGWEKADAEAHALKQKLESITLLKLSAEDRVSHLDGALKECMRQIRNLKEESELKLQETIRAKAKQGDKMKLDLEERIFELEHALVQAGAENASLSQSLQEHLNTIMTVNEEKSHAEAEVEVLRGNIQLRDKEISSLKYELHVVSKEIDIRNQEKNMNLKATEAANKQNLENVKKITKLEAECQRLRGLVQKKLPGPAALARMKAEVESFGQDCKETRNTEKNPGSSLFPKASLMSESLKQCHHRGSEVQGKYFLKMEEEIQTLREALAACNTELQASRSMYAKTTSKVKFLEAQLNQRMRPSSPGVLLEIFSGQIEGTPPSVSSISDDGIVEEGSSSGSWGPLISDISQLWKDKCIDKFIKSSSVNTMHLMDDFLEMEKLACSSVDSSSSKTRLDFLKIAGDTKEVTQPENEGSPEIQVEALSANSHFLKLLSRICRVLECQSLDADVKELVQDIKQSLAPYTLHVLSENNISAKVCALDPIMLMENKISSADTDRISEKELDVAISMIHQFVLSVHGETVPTKGTSFPARFIAQNSLQDFTASVEKFRSNRSSLVLFVIELSHILNKVGEAFSSVSGYRDHHKGVDNCDCIDKVPQLENKDESCRQDKDSTKLQSGEEEKLLAELKLQLEVSQQSHSLAEVRLKCMTESYKVLEMRAHDLEIEVKVLHDKAKKLENKLHEVKNNHRDPYTMPEEAQQKPKRDMQSVVHASSSTAADYSSKNEQQDKEIPLTTEKLVQCQETISILSRQLEALHPHSDANALKPLTTALLKTVYL
ncbi:hypothetical protein SAY86_008676 [Trapa natans]|uniref:Uncharacterized protein n=1 Tax=Trapa natans TaxID=22666 RepID=A0AAN7KEC1_TRANT|nr:hypothetical protein SAY86_008676 [Trapa natans]